MNKTNQTDKATAKEHAALIVCKLELERALERLSNFAELPQWDMNDEETFEAGKQAVAAYEKVSQ